MTTARWWRESFRSSACLHGGGCAFFRAMGDGMEVWWKISAHWPCPIEG